MAIDIFSPVGNPGTALLVDGSALFFGQRAVSPERTLNYIELNVTFQRHCQLSNWAPKPAYFFTAADETNEKQTKFHDIITGLGWVVRQVPPHDAVVVNPLLSDSTAKIIRFDAMLAYALGWLAHSDIGRVIVVSDSWPLSGPVRDCAARGASVTVAFFGSVIDTRWHKLFRENSSRTPNPTIDFLDLDQHAARLFDRTRPTRRKEDDLLNDLPV